MTAERKVWECPRCHVTYAFEGYGLPVPRCMMGHEPVECEQRLSSVEPDWQWTRQPCDAG